MADKDTVYYDKTVQIPQVKDLVGMDTETELIVDHSFPPVVCLQVYCPEFSHFVWWEDIPEYLEAMNDANPHAHYVFHNASFDLGVMGDHKILYKALIEDRLHDTYVIDSLRNIKDIGVVRKDRKLDQIASRRLNVKLDKDDSIRLTFNREMGRGGIPEDHVKYAMKDAKITYKLAEQMNWREFKTETLKTRMMIALDSISRRGFLTEDSVRKDLLSCFEKKVTKGSDMLADWGWYAGEKGNATILQHILEGVEIDMGIKFERSEKTNKIRTTDEALAPIKGDEFLDAYKERAHANKMISTYLGEDNIDEDHRARTRFNLASTGRTTSSKPNIQNVPRKGGIRGMFIPTPGYLMAAVDYAQLELCALAESCFRRFGYSKLMDTINSGVDCHKYVATFYTGKHIKHITKEERQLCKVINFGFPGGLQPSSFVSYAAGYGVKVTEEAAESARISWLKAFPEMEEHLEGIPDTSNLGRYQVKTWTGFERCNLISTEAANTEFQSTSGDGASEMLWDAYVARIKMVNFVHDEIIVEIPITTKEQILKEVYAIDKLMVNSMQKIITHVDIKTETSLMTRWFKEAEEVIGDDGSLQVMTGLSNDNRPIYEPLEKIIENEKRRIA